MALQMPRRKNEDRPSDYGKKKVLPMASQMGHFRLAGISKRKKKDEPSDDGNLYNV